MGYETALRRQLQEANSTNGTNATEACPNADVNLVTYPFGTNQTVCGSCITNSTINVTTCGCINIGNATHPVTFCIDVNTTYNATTVAPTGPTTSTTTTTTTTTTTIPGPPQLDDKYYLPLSADAPVGAKCEPWCSDPCEVQAHPCEDCGGCTQRLKSYTYDDDVIRYLSNTTWLMQEFNWTNVTVQFALPGV